MRLCLATLLLLANAAHAEPPENLVLADVGLHVVGIGYQRTIAPSVALQIDADSYTPWTQEDTFFEVQGFVVRARPIFYKGLAPTGWWLSPFAQAGVASASRGSGFAWAVGASVGYAWLAWERLHIAIGVGAQYDQARIPGGSDKPAFESFWPQLDGTIGYAFE